MELSAARKAYDQTTKKVAGQEEKLYTLEQKLADAYKLVKGHEQQVLSYQNLTEHLRQSITDRDIKLERYKTEWQQKLAKDLSDLRSDLREQYERELVDRHEEYEEKMAERDAKIADLREDLDRTLELLQKANAAVGKDLMAQAMLEKTNNGLEDLCSAMQSGEVEKLLMATQYLDWSSTIVRIAQLHIGVLRRKNELVERLHFTGKRTADIDDNVDKQ